MTCQSELQDEEPFSEMLSECTEFDLLDAFRVSWFPEFPVSGERNDKLSFSYGSTSSESEAFDCSTYPEDEELLTELLSDVSVQTLVSQQQQQQQQQQQPLVPEPTSLPTLPLFEPQPAPAQFSHAVVSVQQPPLFLSPIEWSASWDSGSESSDELRPAVSSHREEEIEAMADYIKLVIDQSLHRKSEDASTKLKVHEVILTILLNASYGDRTKDLRRILAFCDESGRETSCEGRHFKTLDTETMGLLWMKIKGNKKGNYDTFARAMRVRREKSPGYFDYLDSGKRSKKRIYRFGDKAMEEMVQMRHALRQFSAPKSCGY